MCGVTATTKPTRSRLGPVCFRPATKLGPGAQADDADEDGEADRVEHPERRLRDPAEGRPHRAQPAEDEPHDQGAAARRQAERQPADRDRQEPDEPAHEDAEADEDDVGLAATAARCSRAPCPARSTSRGRPGEPQDVAAVDHGRRRRTGSPLPRARACIRTTPRPCSDGELPQRAVDKAPVGQDDVQRDQREVEQRPVLDLDADRGPAARATLRRAASAIASPRWSIISGDPSRISAPSPDPLDEDPVGRERLLEVRHAPIGPRRVVDPVGAQVPLAVGGLPSWACPPCRPRSPARASGFRPSGSP